jgi:Bacteriophage tail sheath protein
MTARISFETVRPAIVVHPDRMDVACFLGFIAERPQAALPPTLIDWLVRRRLATDEELRDPARSDRLLNRPVPIESIQGLQSLFAPELRLDGQAEVASAALREPLALPEGEPLFLDVDGASHEVALDPSLDAAGLRDAIDASEAPVTAQLEDSAHGRHLVIRREALLQPGHVTVLAHPSLGFPRAVAATSRPIDSALGQAVMAFFAAGGRRAYVIRLGDPLPYLHGRDDRLRHLVRLIYGEPTAAQVEALRAGLAPPSILPSPREEASSWYGLAHLFGLADAALICLPDLAELVCPPPAPLAAEPPGPAPRATFERCSESLPAQRANAASSLPAPRCDAEGYRTWVEALRRPLALLRAHARDKCLLACLPTPEDDLVLDRELVGLAPSADGGDAPLASALLQLGTPWLAVAESEFMPGGLMPTDGVLAGMLARSALERGAFRSAAGRLAGVRDLGPEVLADAEQLTRFGRTPGGIELLADHTTSELVEWRSAAVSRLMALVTRAARRIGETSLFEPSGERLWRQVEIQLTSLLRRVHGLGGLAGTAPEDGFSVRCDRSTMTQADIDNGRLVAEVILHPAVPIERIRIRLPLDGSAALGAPT